MTHNIKQELIQAESDADSEMTESGWEEVETIEEECDDIQDEFNSVFEDRN